MLPFYQLFLWPLLIMIVNCDNLLVNTKSGPVRGVEETTFLHKKKYLSYKGIPYAKPPVGELRFRVPVPIEPWRKPLLTNKFGDSCIVLDQSQFFPLNMTQSEDCLYLNVYTPVIGSEKETAKKAVMFFIHGGAFTEGDGTNGFYGPDFLIEHDVLVVTFNYRLGPWGFANFEEPGFTGNMGFKDQQLSLEWIKRNIESFGGDPDLITIFGESAGGAAVHLHTLSERSRMCVKRAIAMSGAAFTYFTHFEENNHIRLIKEVFGLEPNATGSEVLRYMRNAPTELIKQKTPVWTVPLPFGLAALIWGAVVEDKRNAKSPFLTQNPRDIYKTTKIDVDMFFGFTSAEYIAVLNPFDLYHWVEPMQNYSNVGVPFHGLTPECPCFRKVQKLVGQFYFGTKEVTPTMENLNKYVAMNSDSNFVYAIYEAMRMHSNGANTYFYVHDVDLKLNIVSVNYPELTGTSHGEDMLYSFRSNKYSYLYEEALANQNDSANQKTLNALHFIPKLFADFAKTGSAGVKKFTPESPNCVHITNDGLKAIVGPRKEAVEFLDQIYCILKPCIFNQF